MYFAALLMALVAGGAGGNLAVPPGDPAAPQVAAALSPDALSPVADEDALAAAGVYRLDLIPEQGAKIYGLLGTDPVFNGLKTYIAFYGSASEAWVVYPIGDILDYKILSIAPGRADLEIQENPDPMDPSLERTRRMVVTWTPSGGALPSTVAIAPGA
jgi:hypothetical protein